MTPGIGTRYGTRRISIGPHHGRSTTTAEFPAPTGQLWSLSMYCYCSTGARTVAHLDRCEKRFCARLQTDLLPYASALWRSVGHFRRPCNDAESRNTRHAQALPGTRPTDQGAAKVDSSQVSSVCSTAAKPHWRFGQTTTVRPSLRLTGQRRQTTHTAMRPASSKPPRGNHHRNEIHTRASGIMPVFIFTHSTPVGNASKRDNEN